MVLPVRLREVKNLAQGHPASPLWSVDSCGGPYLTPEFGSLIVTHLYTLAHKNKTRRVPTILFKNKNKTNLLGFEL